MAAPRFLFAFSFAAPLALVFAGASFIPIALYKALYLRDLVDRLMLSLPRCGDAGFEAAAGPGVGHPNATLREAVGCPARILYLGNLAIVAAVIGFSRFGAVYLMWFFSFF